MRMRQNFTHDGLTLSYLDSAPDDTNRPVVLLLHGFPDEATMWQRQIDALHAAGYRVLAPDMRGYGESDIPKRQRDHHWTQVVADHVALLDHLDIKQVDVVGHDWGAVFAWLLAIDQPQRVRRAVAMTVGHPTSYARAGLRQKVLGWYTLFFCIPGLSTWLLRGNGWFSLRRVFGTHPQMDHAMARVLRPGRMRAAIRLYRANLASVLFKAHGSAQVPMLGIWASGDPHLAEDQMQNSGKRCAAGWTYERWEGGHWIPLEQPERLTRRLLEWLAD